MKNIEIAKLTGLSASTICKVLKGNKNFSEETIQIITNYKNIEGTKISDFFVATEMKELCELIIEKIKKTDYNDINLMLRFVTECLNWHYVLNGEKETYILRKTPTNLFKEPLFFLMCDIGIKRCKDKYLKIWILNLQNFNANFNYKISK